MQCRRCVLAVIVPFQTMTLHKGCQTTLEYELELQSAHAKETPYAYKQDFESIHMAYISKVVSKPQKSDRNGAPLCRCAPLIPFSFNTYARQHVSFSPKEDNETHCANIHSNNCIPFRDKVTHLRPKAAIEPK